MKNIPFVSVVIPFRNNGKDASECIKSLLNQTYPKNKYELILVNNNSNDKSEKLIEPYLDKLILVDEKKIGRASARNRGISVSKGEIIALIDSDCIADEDWVKKLASSFESNEVNVVAGEIKAYNPKTDIEIFYGQLLSQKKFLSEEFPYAGTANLAFRRYISEEILFDTDFVFKEDVDFCWKLQEKGYKINYQPKAIVYHKYVSTKLQLFKRFFLEGFYDLPLIKKNLVFLEKNKRLKRIDFNSYLNLILKMTQLFSLNSDLNKTHLYLHILIGIAKKIGFFCGSIRYQFIYL